MGELHQLPSGTIINHRYEIIDVIGQGGFGITYKGHDKTLDTPVAIKEYYPSGIASRLYALSLDVQVGGEENTRVFTSGKEKFLEEARTLARISYDPNVVSVRDFFEENKTAYIVMEYVEGDSLDQYMKKHGPLSFREAFELLQPIIQSLSQIHKNGLIHRDISPSNLILDKYGKLKLIDFGTARTVRDEDEKSISIMLKPGFSPPEQYDPHGNQGPWSDVYSLCASIYKLITGDTPPNVLERLLNDTLAAPSSLGAVISPSEEEVLLRGMALKEDERYRSMDELEQAFVDAQQTGANAVPEEITVAGPSASSENETSPAPEPPVYVPAKKEPPVPKEKEAAPQNSSAPSEKEPSFPEIPFIAHAKEKKRWNKRTIVPVIFFVIVVLAVVIGKFVSDGTATGGGKLSEWGLDSKMISFGDSSRTIEITGSMLDQADRNHAVTALSFHNCSFSEDAIKRLGSMARIEFLSFSSCTFSSGLGALSDLETLEELSLSPAWSEKETLNGSEMFDKDMSQVLNLDLYDYTLTGGWDFLSRFSGVEDLNLTNIQLDGTESAFPVLPSLQYLNISGSDLRNTDLSALGQCPELSALNLMDCKLTSLSFLRKATSLERIIVSDNALKTLDGLQDMDSLNTLDVNNNSLSDISALKNCKELNLLYADNNKIGDISALKDCSSLWDVSFSNNRIEDVSALSTAVKLERLALDGNRISDLSAIRPCEEMRELNISRNQIPDLTYCENMLNLVTLKASENQISTLDGLQNVTQLETVFLDRNAISDISLLAKNDEHLKTLVLDNNQISDLSPLKACTHLYAVSANNNRLSSLSGLENCSELYYISASGNQISDISALKACAALYAADLGENRITDVSALGESESQTMALLVQNNQIKDIQPLYGMKNYVYLVLYNNAITDISGMSAMTAIDSYCRLYLEWWDTLDPAELAKTLFLEPILVDVPADRRINFENAFREAREKEDNYFGTINYLTQEEADANIRELRSEIRVAAGIEEEKKDSGEPGPDAEKEAS